MEKHLPADRFCGFCFVVVFVCVFVFFFFFGGGGGATLFPRGVGGVGAMLRVPSSTYRTRTTWYSFAELRWACFIVFLSFF